MVITTVCTLSKNRDYKNSREKHLQKLKEKISNKKVLMAHYGLSKILTINFLAQNPMYVLNILFYLLYVFCLNIRGSTANWYNILIIIKLQNSLVG